MATSDTSTYNITATKLVTRALNICGAVPVGQTPNNSQSALAKNALDDLLKEIGNKTKLLFKSDWIVLPLTASSVVLGTDGTDYECIRPHKAEAATRPVTGANWQGFWKELSTSAGSAWVIDTSYVSIGAIDLDDDVIGVGSGFIRLETSDRALNTGLTTAEYFDYGNKTTDGVPSDVYYRQRRLDIVNGTGTELKNRIFLYPYPEDDDRVINLEVYRYLKDIGDITNNLDIMQNTIKMVIYNLAKDLDLVFRVLTPSESGRLERIADRLLSDFIGYDSEKGDLRMSPRLRR